ncbi:MAG: T9SS type A sorting domain-containing protein [Ignavibacterium sp.]|nr:T9SS type A sorting domain-containing protein [Ignavibacterium sp.]
MKMKILLTVILLSTIIAAQNTYEVQPGVKNNQIVLELSNISSTEQVSLPKPILKRDLKNLSFRDIVEETIVLNPNEEKEIVYTFDVNYNIGNATADTIEFIITDNKSVYLTKQFILNYGVPTEYKLEQNYPNPFNPATKIRYSIPNVALRQAQGDNFTTLKVYDILGNEVTTLVNEQKEPGYYEVDFNASQFASGVYVYRLQSGSYVSSKKMLMIK